LFIAFLGASLNGKFKNTTTNMPWGREIVFLGGSGIQKKSRTYAAPPSFSSARGAGEKKSTAPPRTFAESQTHPSTSQLFFSCLFFKYVFGRFSVRGVQKHHKNIFVKTPCRKLFPKNRQKFRCQFFLDFSGFVVFSGVSQRWESKTLQTSFTKKRCRKVFTKKSTKNPKPIFLSICFITFWAFLGEGG
jgi:hypothetical protein